MAPRLQIEIVETGQFQLDAAFYGLDGKRLESAFDQLRLNPTVGVQRPESPSLWDWNFHDWRITYWPTERLDHIVLLRVVPRQAPKSQAIASVLRLIRLINDVKRLFGY